MTREERVAPITAYADKVVAGFSWENDAICYNTQTPEKCRSTRIRMTEGHYFLPCNTSLLRHHDDVLQHIQALTTNWNRPRTS